ncbi:MAG: small-conductance mechanosensitive channel [Bradymonadia bacterium]|jgi:small-conductance mechanosensitive channel
MMTLAPIGSVNVGSVDTFAVVATAAAIGLVTLVVAGVLVALSLRERGTTPEREAEQHRARTAVVFFAIALVLVATTLGASRGAYPVALPPVLLLMWAFRHWFENLAGGLVLAVTRPFRCGDWVRWKTIDGEVCHIGLTQVRLRAADETVSQVPHRLLLASPITNLSRQAMDAPVEVTLPMRTELAPIEARALAAVCAATSPYASLRRRPETFTAFDNAGRLEIRVRGYAVDALHIEQYRSHIVEAWFESTGEQASDEP